MQFASYYYETFSATRLGKTDFFKVTLNEKNLF